jgi:hypothetical protein
MLTQTEEWRAYVASPGTGLAALHARVGGATDDLLIALASHERMAGDWRVAQHLAILFLERGWATEAHYYANRAVEASGGHVLAHVALSRVMELRRFPSAVLYQLEQVRLRLKHLRGDREKMERVRGYVTSAYVRTYGYLGDLARARPWSEKLRRTRYAEIQAFVPLFHASAHDESGLHGDLLRLAALRVAESGVPLSGRAAAKLVRIVRGLLLNVLSRRAS